MTPGNSDISHDASERLKAVLVDILADPLVPSVTATVRAPGQRLDWTLCVENTDPGSDSPANLAERPFRIASVTKTFVAAALLRLAETDTLRLHHPISDYLGRDTLAVLRRAGYNPDCISLRHLLTHTSGLRDHLSPDYESRIQSDPGHHWTRAEVLALSASLGGPLFEPGKGFSYADLGYILLGEIVEKVTSDTLASSVRRLVDFDRLGLSSTWWEMHEPAPAGMLPVQAQYLGQTDGRAWHPSFDLYGGGGLISTTTDLATAMRAIVRGEVFAKASTLAAALWVPEVPRQPEHYLHAALVMDLPMGRLGGWGHSGFWGCAAVHAPDVDVTIAITINQSTPSQSGLLRTALTRLADVVAN